jgi:hypothetical protein
MQVRAAIDTRKKLMRHLSTVCLASVPFWQMGVAKHQGVLATLTPPMLFSLLLAVFAALCTIRAINLLFFSKFSQFREGRGHRTPDTIRRAVMLAANQKTLPISIAVLIQLSDAVGQGVGLAMLACILAHFMQVVIDSLIVDNWQREDAQLEAQPA